MKERRFGRGGKSLIVIAVVVALIVLSAGSALALPTGKTVRTRNAVTITKQPAAATVLVGDTAKFTVTATGSGTLKYKWQAYNPSTKKWTDSGAAGANTATLSIKAQAAHNNFLFRCQITDASGKTTTSSSAKLTVKAKITTQPKNATVAMGDVAKFSVVADGKATLKYQWQAKSPSAGNWVDSSAASAKSATLSITAQTGHNAYAFRCVVTDGNGNKTISNAATLNVTAKISTQPKTTSATIGNTATFTVKATGKGMLKYQWQAQKPGTTTWVNSSAAGAKTTSLKVKTVFGHDNYKFRCVVTDANGNSVASSAATLTLNIPTTRQYFDDTVFNAYVKAYDKNYDGLLSYAERAAVKEMHINGMAIYNLEGIEYFPKLQVLMCDTDVAEGRSGYNYIEELDLSYNTELTTLVCAMNNLTELDLSKNTKLTHLNCYGNQLGELNLSKNTKLTYVDCGGNTLWSLTLGSLPVLETFRCNYNTLGLVDVSGCPALKDLDVSFNYIATLNVSKNKKLRTLSLDVITELVGAPSTTQITWVEHRIN